MDGSVIVPLYVYPSMAMWEPVYAMAATYPQVQFTAIVNVHNGPGEGALPNQDYSHAIGTLNSFQNVRTVGYVATTWCARNLTLVLDDVAAYSFWGYYNTSLAIDGIFFDETPTQYSPDSVSYLQTIAQAVRTSGGLKDGYIVHNPGALPNPEFFEDATSKEGAHLSPNLTVVFENAFSNWTAERLELAEATKLYDRSKLAVVLHSVPELTIVDLKAILRQLLTVGHSMWLTSTDDYGGLDAHFTVFIDSLAALLS